MAAVDRGVDAADHRDAERPAEQPRGVVDGRADPGLLARHDAHDRLGRRRAGQAHARAVEDHLDRDRRVAGRRRDDAATQR